MQQPNNSNNNNNNNNPFISAYPAYQHQTVPTATTANVFTNPPLYNNIPPQQQCQYVSPQQQHQYVPPPMYQRAKSREELEMERKDAELARTFADEKSPKLPQLREDEDFAKRLVFDESLKTKEQKMVQLLQDEAAAQRLQKEEEALLAIRKRDEERDRQDAEEARRLQFEEENMNTRRREREETERKDREAAMRFQQEEESLRRMVAEQDERDKNRKVQQIADEELAIKFQREEERRIQEEKDKDVARSFQEEERREAERERKRMADETRRIREEERRRDEERRREEDRVREAERRRVNEERRKVDQILSDAELARRLENQLYVVQPTYSPPYVPPAPQVPAYATVNHHTLEIHTQYCGCNKHNNWNNNHITKIHNKYCNCPHPHTGYYTNSGILHTHGVGCRFYCKYQNHVHTAECCRKAHVHNNRCHCSAKFL